MALSPQPGHSARDEIRGLALCCGAGGLELGLRIAEPRYRTVGYVERDAGSAALLVARMAEAALCDAPIWDDLTTFDGRPWRGRVDILSAGYPCQPFSAAGRRRGTEDPRHLWPHVERIIQEAQPSRVFCENVEGHLSLGFAEVAGRLQSLGFRVKAGLFTAREVGAPQRRARLFIMADAYGGLFQGPGGPADRAGRPRLRGTTDHLQQDRDDADRDTELDGAMAVSPGNGLSAGAGTLDVPTFPPAPADFAAWEAVLAERPDLQPALFGLADGLAARLERSFATGNGVVPLAAAFAYRTLAAA